MKKNEQNFYYEIELLATETNAIAIKNILKEFKKNGLIKELIFDVV
jgi:hypothetical protein